LFSFAVQLELLFAPLALNQSFQNKKERETSKGQTERPARAHMFEGNPLLKSDGKNLKLIECVHACKYFSSIKTEAGSVNAVFNHK